MRSRIWFIVLLTGALWLAPSWSFAAPSGSLDAGIQQTLRAAVAANFRKPFIKLSEHDLQSSSVTVLGIFGSSGMLSAQIQQGAPFDLFFSADSQRPHDLVTSGHAAGEPFTYARGRLILWMPGGIPVPRTPGPSASIESGVAGRFALANPELAPYGRAARECLRSMKLWEQANERAVYGHSISQTYHFVASRGVPAGFIAFSQAVAQNIPSNEVWLVPPTCHLPINQQVVGLRSTQPEAVERFLEFIASADARSIIGALGYVNPQDESHER
ncbi:MAG: molybdate ABC transporter substrate-binding protein [Gammaproteobacteria bacterium]|nr:molybdate ABC transporter substrate-binding protein [Gammaproteobacteria bacterium]